MCLNGQVILRMCHFWTSNTAYVAFFWTKNIFINDIIITSFKKKNKTARNTAFHVKGSRDFVIAGSK